MGDIAAKTDTALPAVSKAEDNVADRSSTSSASTPEGEHEHEREPEAGAEAGALEQPQQQKRKGGRKPVSNFPPSFSPRHQMAFKPLNVRPRRADEQN